jgi:hypothetical protein
MSLDPVGVLDLPVNYTADTTGDPVRRYLGDFLQSGIRAACQAAWAKLGGGTNVVERVEVNDPKDNTFSTAKLPAIFVYREDRSRSWDLVAADIGDRVSTIVALWVPNVAVQEWRAKREPFFQAIEATVMDVCDRERTPGWKLSRDTDPNAAVEGSHISTAMRVLRPISYGVSFDDYTVEVEMADKSKKAFPALKISFKIWEQMDSGPIGAIYPAALDITLENSSDETLGELEDIPA